MKLKLITIFSLFSTSLITANCELDCGWDNAQIANNICQNKCGSYGSYCKIECCKAKCGNDLDCFYACQSNGCSIV